MNNNLKQQISEFLDDELNSPAALRLLSEALEDAQILTTLNRYATIRQAIKNDRLLISGGSFLQNVSAQIQQEPAYLLPNRKPQTARHRRYRSLALAASIAIVAVLGTQIPDQAVTTDLSDTGLAVADLPADQTKTGLETAKPEQTPLNQRIYDYLQAHNSGLYASGDPTSQPTVKVTAYSE